MSYGRSLPTQEGDHAPGKAAVVLDDQSYPVDELSLSVSVGLCGELASGGTRVAKVPNPGSVSALLRGTHVEGRVAINGWDGHSRSGGKPERASDVSQRDHHGPYNVSGT